MTHSIDQKLTQLEKRAQNLARWFGLCAFVAIVVVTLLGIAWLDQWWRYDHSFYRYIGFVILCEVGLVSLRYLLVPALRYRPHRLSLALRLESLYPSLRDRLSSAVDFLDAQMRQPPSRFHARTRRADSAAMQNAVIAQVDELITQLPWRKALNPSMTYTAIVFAGLSVVTLLIWGLVDREGSRIAIQRNLAPWTAVQWPRRNQLAFDPQIEIVKRGGAAEFRVIDRRGRLPELIELDVMEVDRDAAVVYEMGQRDDEAFLYLDNLQQDILVRARGGDDQTEWLHVHVVNAPQVESLTVTIDPPSYLSIQPLTTSGTIQAWKGSLISWAGRVDRPVESAALIITTPSGTMQRSLELDATRTQFHLPTPAWPLDSVGTYQLEIVDQQGVIGGLDTPAAIRIVEDQPPSVQVVLETWQQVSTPRGKVPYRIEARDDVRLSRGQFSVTRDNVMLLESSLDLKTSSQRNDNTAADATALETDRFEATRELRLSQFQQLKPGDELQFRAVVEDDLGQVGLPSPVPLMIISDDEYLERLSGLELQIQEQLRTAHQVQLRANRWLEEMQGLVDEPTTFLQRVDELDFTQRQVGELLSERSQGASQLTQELLHWLTLQQLVDTTLGSRTQHCLETLSGLREEPLGRIQSAIDTWLASADSETAEQPPSSESLRRASLATREWQDNVTTTLQSLIDLMGQSRQIRGMIDELRQIRVDQEQFAADLHQFHLRNLQDSAEDQRQVDRLALASRQERMAERLAALLENIQSLVNAPDSDPENVSHLAGVIDLAERLIVVGTMRDATNQIRESRLGQAVATQPVILDALAKLLEFVRQSESMAQRRLADLTRAQQGFTAALAEQRDVVRQLDALLQKQAAGGTISEDERRRIAQQQREVGRAFEQVAVQLEANGQTQLARRLRDIQRALQTAVDQAVADLNESNMRTVREELASLDEIQSELAREMQQQTQQQFNQEREQWVQLLKQLRQQQQTLIDDTARWTVDDESLDELTADELRRLREAQADLLAQSQALMDKRTSIPTLALIMRQVAQEMTRAVRNLNEIADVPRATAAMQSAQRLMDDVLQALAPSSRPMQATPEQTNEADETQPPKTAQSASLRTIRILQQFVFDQTVALEQKVADGNLARSREDYQQLAELGQTQRLLIALVETLQADIRHSLEESGETQKTEEPQKPPLQIPLPGIDR